VIDTVKADKAIQAGDMGTRSIALVDSKVMPHVNFERMTASAVGPQWRQATPEQQASCRRVQDAAGAHLCRCAHAR
jgi:phospholipid transport system substrate-binding protein